MTSGSFGFVEPRCLEASGRNCKKEGNTGARSLHFACPPTTCNLWHYISVPSHLRETLPVHEPIEAPELVSSRPAICRKGEISSKMFHYALKIQLFSLFFLASLVLHALLTQDASYYSTCNAAYLPFTSTSDFHLRDLNPTFQERPCDWHKLPRPFADPG